VFKCQNGFAQNGREAQAQVLQINNNLRNAQIRNLKVQLHDAQKEVKDLQGQQQGLVVMQTWFLLHRGLLESLMYGGDEKNSDDDNDGQENGNHDGDNSVHQEKNTERDELSEGNDDEIEDLNDGDGQENENHDGESHSNGEKREAKGEEEEELLFESDDEEEVEEFDIPSE
jgi:hypothetical protein